MKPIIILALAIFLPHVSANKSWAGTHYSENSTERSIRGVSTNELPAQSKEIAERTIKAASARYKLPPSGRHQPDFFSKSEVANRYPWLSDIAFGDEDKLPKNNAIHTWSINRVPIVIGYPNNLEDYKFSWLYWWKKITRDDRVKLTDDAATTAIIDNLDKIIKGMAEDFNKLSNVPNLYFEENNKEVMQGIYVLPFKTRLSNKYRRSADITQSAYGQEIEMSFLEFVYTYINERVDFAQTSAQSIAGFFISNEKNEILQSYCYIWDGHPQHIVQELVAQCIAKSLGLPNLDYVLDSSAIDSLSKKEGVMKAYYDLLSVLYHPTLRGNMK